MKTAALKLPSLLPRVLWMRRKCPLCSSVQFEAAVPEPRDKLLAPFRLRPVRCVNCWRRYYSFAGLPNDR